MGTLRKHGRKWRAEVCVNRTRRSRVCRTKAEAEAWIEDQERILEAGPDRTLAQVLERYIETHVGRKVRSTAEENRCKRLSGDLGHLRLNAMTSDDLARWRDERLSEVAPSTVRRDWNLLNHALNVAVKEWGWLKINPLASLKRPTPPRPRARVWSDSEIKTFLHCTGWTGRPGNTLQGRVGDCLLFALETGMRAGEIVELRPGQVFERHVHLPRTKNGSARDVPLSTRAREILDSLLGENSYLRKNNRLSSESESDPVFGITSAQLDALFRKARDRACLVDLRFHDTRRTALTRLSKKLDALELARVSGHKDLRILLDTYYQPTIEDLAGKLD